jgi:hypothetical protein
MKWTSVAWLATLLLSVAANAASVDTLSVDLNSLIDAAAASKNRFAVDIAHPVSGAGTWTYSVRIPGAISMSFHASEVSLPADAVLTVTSGNTTTTYHASDINRGGLWGRPQLGDTLNFTLSGPAASLHIQSFQAGYRALASVVPDNPHYTARLEMAAPADCTQNYSCNVTDDNQGPARATVAVVVGNQYTCTGTLMNNTSNDATPYVLTARHCQTGTMGGGDPDAASAVTIYWDAVTACGSVLGSIYTGGTMTQSGATTVVEQQDAWLIRLNSAPAAPDAWFAGWDATGGVFTGGYSIHHALGNNKQYVMWSGQAVWQSMPRAAVRVNYESTFWGLVNGVGHTGAGASGAALFDPSNRVVGSASLAALVGGGNTAGSCPVNPAPAAATAQYTALAGVWNSMADATSSTGNVTLQSVLDPTNTGKVVMDGSALMPVTLTADTSFLRTDQRLTLTWNVPDALSCTASGGQPGDGWAGSRSSSGSVEVSSSAGGHVEYGLNCRTADHVGNAAVGVDWTYVQPVAWVGVNPDSVEVGEAMELSWYSNVGPCTASGGQTGDGWAGAKAGSGTQTVSASKLGKIAFTLTCGTYAQVASYKATVTVTAPGSEGAPVTVGTSPPATVTATPPPAESSNATGALPGGDNPASDGASTAGGASPASGGSGAGGNSAGANGGSAGVGGGGAGANGGGGALDLYWLCALGALLAFKARATRSSRAVVPRESPAAAHRPSQW